MAITFMVGIAFTIVITFMGHTNGESRGSSPPLLILAKKKTLLVHSTRVFLESSQEQERSMTQKIRLDRINVGR